MWIHVCVRVHLCVHVCVYSETFYNNTIGNKNFVCYSEVSLTQGLLVYLIWLLSTTSLRIQSVPLLYAGRECYAEASTTSNSASLISSC